MAALLQAPAWAVALQAHAGPQAQPGPHWQVAGAADWQPQVQPWPGQFVQLHGAFTWSSMVFSCSGWVVRARLPDTRSLPAGAGAGLNVSAEFS